MTNKYILTISGIIVSPLLWSAAFFYSEGSYLLVYLFYAPLNIVWHPLTFCGGFFLYPIYGLVLDIFRHKGKKIIGLLGLGLVHYSCFLLTILFAAKDTGVAQVFDEYALEQRLRDVKRWLIFGLLVFAAWHIWVVLCPKNLRKNDDTHHNKVLRFALIGTILNLFITLISFALLSMIFGVHPHRDAYSNPFFILLFVLCMGFNAPIMVIIESYNSSMVNFLLAPIFMGFIYGGLIGMIVSWIQKRKITN